MFAEQQLGSGFAERHEAERVDDRTYAVGHLRWQAQEASVAAGQVLPDTAGRCICRWHGIPPPVIVNHLDRHLFLLVFAKIGQCLALREIGRCNDLFLHLLRLLDFTVAASLVTFGHFSFS
ncbi:MAG: hypothetical protein HUJ24_05675 [Rhodobacteraceae bacterium]|nr:hypothetical protein [Paracoccaceae bacterium]